MDTLPPGKPADAPGGSSACGRDRVRRWFGRQFSANSDDFTDRRANLSFLILYGALVIVPLLFAPTADGEAISLDGYRMPPGCFSRQVLGVSCPGCGLGRSFVETAHGRFSTALARHRLGVALYALFLGQALLRAWCLWHGSRPLPRKVVLAHHWAAIAMISLLIGNWVVGLWLGGNGF